MRCLLAQTVWLPCAGVEEGSWLWYIRGCWVYQVHVTAMLPAFMLAALTGVLLVSLRQRAVRRVL